MTETHTPDDRTTRWERYVALGCGAEAVRAVYEDRIEALEGLLSNMRPAAAPARAIDDVIAERERQRAQEGWTPEHDDEHTDGSLALAAVCYGLPIPLRTMEEREFDRDVGRTVGEPIIVRDKVSVPHFWPQSWHGGWWKPKDRRRDLVRAAALILAEIERLDRSTGDAEGEDCHLLGPARTRGELERRTACTDEVALVAKLRGLHAVLFALWYEIRSRFGHVDDMTPQLRAPMETAQRVLAGESRCGGLRAYPRQPEPRAQDDWTIDVRFLRLVAEAMGRKPGSYDSTLEEIEQVLLALEAIGVPSIETGSGAKAPAVLHAIDAVQPPKVDCWCYDCNRERIGLGGLPITATRMIVCPDCGAKRCPRATDHRHACTSSNAPGQPGSRFEAAP